MRVTTLTQPQCKITYKYLNIKILQRICLFALHKFNHFFQTFTPDYQYIIQ